MNKRNKKEIEELEEKIEELRQQLYEKQRDREQEELFSALTGKTVLVLKVSTDELILKFNNDVILRVDAIINEDDESCSSLLDFNFLSNQGYK